MGGHSSSEEGGHGCWCSLGPACVPGVPRPLALLTPRSGLQDLPCWAGSGKRVVALPPHLSCLLEQPTH